MNKKLLVTLGVVFIVAITTWRGCRYDWNPHYASNKAIQMGHSLYNSDSSAAVVDYTLDVGARGLRDYQTLLRKDDYQGSLSEFMLPAEYTEPKWQGRDTLEVIYAEAEAFLRGGNATNVQKEKDIVTLNGVVIIVRERRVDKWHAIKDYKDNVNRYAR